MPAPKRVLNGFTPKSVMKLTGISVHMLNYLCRHGYIEPAYSKAGGIRGRVRYFSYRDLVIARVIQRLRLTGVKLRKIKTAVNYLHEDHAWFPTRARRTRPVQWLVSDGRQALLQAEDGFLDELKPGGQRAFAFIVSLGGIQDEVKSKIQQVEPKKLQYFSIRNLPLIYEQARRQKSRAG